MSLLLILKALHTFLGSLLLSCNQYLFVGKVKIFVTNFFTLSPNIYPYLWFKGIFYLLCSCCCLGRFWRWYGWWRRWRPWSWLMGSISCNNTRGLFNWWWRSWCITSVLKKRPFGTKFVFINPFRATDPFWYPLIRKPLVFRGYQKRSV